HSQDVLKCAAGDSFEVAVISSNLDGPLTGFDVLRQLRVLNSCLRGIMLLDSSRREVVLEAFRAGARGIFSRHEYIETLSKHIRSVHHGQLCANSQQMSYAVEALSSGPVLRAVDSNGLSLLSERELEVVRSLAEGLTNREIAERLGLSQHTIKNYLFRVFDKLGVSNRLELLFMTLSQSGIRSTDDAPRRVKGKRSRDRRLEASFLSASYLDSKEGAGVDDASTREVPEKPDKPRASGS